MRMLTTLLSVVAISTLSFAADETRRFPSDRITLEQWETYLAEVKALPNVMVRESNQQITITDQSADATLYAFTTNNNPAHPAIVIRKLVKMSDGMGINRVGYYVGNADVFARWWAAFDSLDAKVKADLNPNLQTPAQVSQPDIQVRKNRDSSFHLTLTSKTIDSVRDAQRALVPKARELCADKRPKFDLYKVHKVEKVDSPSSTSGQLSIFKFDQDILCEAVANP